MKAPRIGGSIRARRKAPETRDFTSPAASMPPVRPRAKPSGKNSRPASNDRGQILNVYLGRKSASRAGAAPYLRPALASPAAIDASMACAKRDLFHANDRHSCINGHAPFDESVKQAGSPKAAMFLPQGERQ
ncbi:MAG: hypothetical protein M3Q11_05515 [Pseudomonadota bacterium]|nr:hypothetical protein [Pseudomonadota bacterium]